MPGPNSNHLLLALRKDKPARLLTEAQEIVSQRERLQGLDKRLALALLNKGAARERLEEIRYRVGASEREVRPSFPETAADKQAPKLAMSRKGKPSFRYPRTDLGNADYFVDTFGDILRYDKTRGRWLVWHKHRWEPDLIDRALELAQQAARDRLTEALNIPRSSHEKDEDPNANEGDFRDNAIKWALQSEGRHRIDNVLALADDRESITVRTAEGWDSDPWLLGVSNGVIDLRTGILRPGRQDDKITKHAGGCAYDPLATCPRWEQFLREVLGGNVEIVTFVRRAVGYTLTGHVSEDCWLGCYGTGQNGKTTFINALRTLLGDYSYTASFSLVERGRGESRKDFDIAYLQNQRFVIASETREGVTWDEERLKKLTGRDSLHAEIKYGAEFEFLPTHKLWFMFNHKPRSKDHSPGFWRRPRLIPFTVQFQGDACDKDLDEKLKQEQQGILAWAVRAAKEWHDKGLQAPAAVLEVGEQYKADEDPLTGFIEKYTDLEGPGFYLLEAYKLYRDWCKDEQNDNYLGKTRFSALLESHGFKRAPGRDATKFLTGKLTYIRIELGPRERGQ